MTNIANFNNVLFNGWRKVTAWAGVDDIVFNWFWLQNSNYMITEINVWNMPKINLLTYDNPKNDWWGVLDRFYKQRTISMSGRVKWSDSDDIEDKIDNLKKALSVKTWYLDFKVKWVYRRILCSLTNSDIIDRKHYDIDHWKFKLTFTALEPFWSEKTWSTATFVWVNDEINEDINNEWSEYSNPIINILVNSASSMTQIKVKIWDNQIVIDKAINTADIIEINTATKEVLINEQSVDFSWKFPRLASGVNWLNVVANGTFDLDIAILYPKNYL